MKIVDPTRSLVQPKHILMNLKDKNQESLTNIKQVYNACHRFKKSERDNKIERQHLVTKLDKHKYVHFTGTYCEATTVYNIFWAHPESINWIRTPPIKPTCTKLHCLR